MQYMYMYIPPREKAYLHANCKSIVAVVFVFLLTSSCIYVYIICRYMYGQHYNGLM